MKRIIKIKVLVLSAILAFSVSCRESILDVKDQSNYNSDTYFNSPEGIQKAVNATYSSFYFNSMFAWRWNEMFDALANEFEGTAGALANEADIAAIWHYEYNNQNVAIKGYWRLLYKMVLRANLVIEKGTAYTTANGDNTIVKQSMGEAYFLRGWAYTQLAFYWGGVPIRVKFTDPGNEDLVRSSAEEVWAVAEADFKLAQKLLPASYDDANLGRATSGAATGFLGKLYLYTKKYTEADAEFAKLTGYGLLPKAQWLDNFGQTNENNNSSLFEVQFKFNQGDGQWGMFNDVIETSGQAQGLNNIHSNLYSWNDWGNWKVQPRRIADFVYNDESGKPYIDPRAELTFYGGIGDNTWCDDCPEGKKSYDFAAQGYWYRKATNMEVNLHNNAEAGNNVRLMRYADVLLMRAECKIQAGDIAGGITYINLVRNNIGGFSYTKTYSKNDAMTLLMRERQIEFLGEASRFNDLKRWGILLETMNPEMLATHGKQTVEQKHYFFPIPQIEIDSNLKLGAVNNNWN